MFKPKDNKEEIEKKVSVIDSKLQKSFQSVKQDIASLKSSQGNFKKIEDKLSELQEDLRKTKFEKEKKEKTLDVSKEIALRREIESLKFQVEKERQKNELEIQREKQKLELEREKEKQRNERDKQKSVYLLKIAELKARLNEKSEFKTIKREYEKQLAEISRSHEASQKRLLSQIEGNNRLVKEIEFQRKKDFEKSLKDKEELSEIYDLKLQEVQSSNHVFQKELLGKIALLGKSFSDALKDSNKKFEKTLQRLEEKRQEDNLLILKQLAVRKQEVPRKEEKRKVVEKPVENNKKGFFTKIVDSLSDESPAKKDSLPKKKDFLTKIVDGLAD